MKQQWQKNDELLKAMIILLFTHHSFDMLKPTCYHSPVLFYSFITAAVCSTVELGSFQWFYKGLYRSKNHLKRKLLPVKKIQHKPPVLYLPKGYGWYIVDGCIADSGYNQLLMGVTTGSLRLLHTIVDVNTGITFYSWPLCDCKM